MDVVKEAGERYLHDAEFHAAVYRVVAVLAFDLREKTGATMSDEDRSLATISAAVALNTPSLVASPSR